MLRASQAPSYDFQVDWLDFYEGKQLGYRGNGAQYSHGRARAGMEACPSLRGSRSQASVEPLQNLDGKIWDLFFF